MNREVRKKMKAAKEEWIDEQDKNIEEEMMTQTARRPTRFSSLRPKPNSMSQQSSKTAVKTS